MLSYSLSSIASSSVTAARARRWSNVRTLFAGLVVAVLASFAGNVYANDGANDGANDLPTLPITVNVNTADARTISNVLQGVGPSRAAAIVAYREEHGAFKQVDDLGKVKGVGDRTLELNATRILLSD